MSGNFLYVTVAGIYALRRLQIKRCGRLGLKAVLALDCCLVLAWMSKLGWCWWYLYFKVSREKTYRRFVWQSDFRHGWEWCRELSVDGLCRRLAFGYQMVAVRGCCCRNLRTQAWTICFVDWTLACLKVFCWWPWSIWILVRTSVSWLAVVQGFEAVQIFNVPRGLGANLQWMGAYDVRVSRLARVGLILILWMGLCSVLTGTWRENLINFCQ